MRFPDQAAAQALKKLLPQPVFRRFRNGLRPVQRKLLAFDRVRDFSVLRRVKPYRPAFGLHRGQSVDRYYIENFLAIHRGDIRGRVLEIQNDAYTRQFGGPLVTHVDILDIDTENGARTITDDLTHAASIPDNSFDCIILTQTLLLIYDLHAAIRTLRRILKPGGAVLVTMPCIAQVVPPVMAGGGADYWRLTPHSAKRLFSESFGEVRVEVTTFGNVLAATALLHGLVASELARQELDYHDPDYAVIVGITARK